MKPEEITRVAHKVAIRAINEKIQDRKALGDFIASLMPGKPFTEWEQSARATVAELIGVRDSLIAQWSPSAADQPAEPPADRISVVVSDHQREALRMLWNLAAARDIDGAEGFREELPEILFARESAAELLATAKAAESTGEGQDHA
jgi:hypothetical protein